MTRQRNPAKTFVSSPTIAFVTLNASPATFALVDTHAVAYPADIDFALENAVVGFLATAQKSRHRGNAYTYVEQLWAEDGYGPMLVEGAAQWLADHGRVRLGPGDNVQPPAVPLWKKFEERGWSSGTYPDFRHRPARPRHLDKLYRPPKRVQGFEAAQDRGRDLWAVIEQQDELGDLSAEEAATLILEAGDAKFRRAIERARNPISPAAHRVDFDRKYNLYKDAYERAFAALGEYAAMKGSRRPDVGGLGTDGAYFTFIEGRGLVQIAAATRAIPKDKAKAFAKAYREFVRRTRPKNIQKWFMDNVKSAQLLLETNSWKPLGDVEEAKTNVGGFVIINQSGRDISANIKLVQAASDAVQNSGIPNAEKILYGDIFLTGDFLRKKGVMAQYSPDSDKIQVILVEKYDDRFLQNLIHELAHRYWRKGYPDKVAWVRYDTNLHYEATKDAVLPPVGSSMEFSSGPPLRVERYDYNAIIFVDAQGMKRKAPLSQIKKVLSQRRLLESFPTAYSMMNAEEHFCEAFSHYCLGDLKEPNRANFEALIVRLGAP